MRNKLEWAAVLAAVLTVLALASTGEPQGAPVREGNESIANYAGASALVEHDTNLVSPPCRAIYTTSAGNVVVDMAREGNDITFPVDANRIYELRIKRFKTASTATAICLY